MTQNTASPANPAIVQIEDYQQFSKEYQFSKFIHDNGLNVSIYFDASDLIALVSGIHNLDDPRELKLQMKNYETDAYLVYAFAFRGWLGAINFLSPHLYEFLEKTKTSQSLFPPSLNNEQKDRLFQVELNNKNLVDNCFYGSHIFHGQYQ